MSRDEKLVLEMNIPCSVEDIIHKPMEEFNDILSRHSVSEEVINICRDIRRRGKNKVGPGPLVSETCGGDILVLKLIANFCSRLQHRTAARGKLSRFTVWRRNCTLRGTRRKLF